MVDDAIQASGNAWGDDISDERKAWLEARFQAWANAANRHLMRGPFDRDSDTGQLTGADVFWLAARTLAGSSNDNDMASAKARLLDRKQPMPQLSELHLERANLFGAHLEGANLRAAHLEGADLQSAHLEGANLVGAHLEAAYLMRVHMEGADLGAAHLEVIDLLEAHLQGANLRAAHVEGADLMGAHLEGADLVGAHLEGAGLINAQLEGADLLMAHLDGKQFAEDDADLERIRQWVPRFPSKLSPATLRLTLSD